MHTVSTFERWIDELLGTVGGGLGPTLIDGHAPSHDDPILVREFTGPVPGSYNRWIGPSSVYGPASPEARERTLLLHGAPGSVVEHVDIDSSGGLLLTLFTHYLGGDETEFDHAELDEGSDVERAHHDRLRLVAALNGQPVPSSPFLGSLAQLITEETYPRIIERYVRTFAGPVRSEGPERL